MDAAMTTSLCVWKVHVSVPWGWWMMVHVTQVRELKIRHVKLYVKDLIKMAAYFCPLNARLIESIMGSQVDKEISPERWIFLSGTRLAEPLIKRFSSNSCWIIFLPLLIGKHEIIGFHRKFEKSEIDFPP